MLNFNECLLQVFNLNFFPQPLDSPKVEEYEVVNDTEEESDDDPDDSEVSNVTENPKSSFSVVRRKLM